MMVDKVSVFNGKQWYNSDALNINAIQALYNDAANVSDVPLYDKWLIPALIDCQVYGAGGRLFAQYPDHESLDVLATENAKSGTALCLVTIATQPFDVIELSINAVKSYLQKGGTGIHGLHLEGPFINAAKRGAHIKEWVVKPGVEILERWLGLAEGCIKMITLAPENCSDDVLMLLNKHDVIISAGHSAIDYSNGMHLHKRGVETVTHLFNAMNGLHHREPGLALAALTNNNLYTSIIPDGIHVQTGMLKLATDVKQDKLFFITDAVTETNEGAYQHHDAGDRYCVADGTLSGSKISMLQGVAFAVQKAAIPLNRAINMASYIPAELLKIDMQIIIPSAQSKSILINSDFKLLHTFNF